MSLLQIVGLGPGAFDLLTLETWDILRRADLRLLRTAKHPVAGQMKERGLSFDSYDYLAAGNSWAAVSREIAVDCLQKAQTVEKTVFAVPGNPLVKETAVRYLRRLAADQGLTVKVYPGLGFLDLLYARLGVEPVKEDNIIEAADLDNRPPELTGGVVITGVGDRETALAVQRRLLACGPADYPLTVVNNLGWPAEAIWPAVVADLAAFPAFTDLTAIYLPPEKSGARRFTVEPLVRVMDRLRAPDGCVWDREQTHHSLRQYLVEEVYEVLEAIDLADAGKLCEELGDLLLQIVFQAKVAEENGTFSLPDVVNTVTEKMIRRHPHVFGNTLVRNSAEVLVNWERIKQQEKGGERSTVLSGIPPGLPSLLRAYKLQTKAAKVGFDWPSIEPVWDKLNEEVGELTQAVRDGEATAIEAELGDVLFAAVNLARFLAVEPEVALNACNNRFSRRFNYLEARLTERGLDWRDVDLSQLDELWEEAKRADKIKNIKNQ